MRSLVELVYFIGCPNAGVVFETLKAHGIAFGIVLQDRLEEGDPKLALSSPSVLIDGIQVLGAVSPKGSASCSWEKITPEVVLASVLHELTLEEREKLCL